MPSFAWASMLGASVVLFLAYAALATGIGLVLPFAVRARPAATFGLFHERPDALLFGTPPLSVEAAHAAGLHRALVWWWFGGVLVSLGILQASVAWFALREGLPWALPVLALADLAVLPFGFLVGRAYVAAGAAPRFFEVPPLLWFPATVIPVAILLGWLGTR